MIRRQQSVKVGVVDFAAAEVRGGRAAERLVCRLIHECIQEIAFFFAKWHAESTPGPSRLVYQPLLFRLPSRTRRKAGLRLFEDIHASSCLGFAPNGPLSRYPARPKKLQSLLW